MATPFRPQRILVPVDFSAACERAVETALELARTYDAKLVLLHVWMPPAVSMLDAAYIPTGPEVAAQTDGYLRELEGAAARIPLPPERVERHLRMGQPWREITDGAVAERCDVIVMGTHGRTGLAHVALGSVAEHVVRTARVPVLVVPTTR